MSTRTHYQCPQCHESVEWKYAKAHKAWDEFIAPRFEETLTRTWDAPSFYDGFNAGWAAKTTTPAEDEAENKRLGGIADWLMSMSRKGRP